MTLPKPIKQSKPKRRIKRTTRPRRQRRTSLAALKRELWALFSRYVKDRDGPTCFTCGAKDLEGGNWHAGHCIRMGGHAAVAYDPKNVHSQCGACNIWRDGNVAEYVIRLVERYGYEEFERLVNRSRQTKLWTAPEIRGLIEALQRGPVEYECYYYDRYL